MRLFWRDRCFQIATLFTKQALMFSLISVSSCCEFKQYNFRLVFCDLKFVIPFKLEHNILYSHLFQYNVWRIVQNLIIMTNDKYVALLHIFLYWETWVILAAVKQGTWAGAPPMSLSAWLLIFPCVQRGRVIYREPWLGQPHPQTSRSAPSLSLTLILRQQ